MINEKELKELENSTDIRALLQEAQSIRDTDNEQCTPPSFDHLMQRMETQSVHRPAIQPTGQRRTISPWWLAAACFIGLLIGVALPRPWEKHEPSPLSSLLQADTTRASLGESLSQEGFPMHLIVTM